MKALWQVVAFLLSGLLSANAQAPNAYKANGLDTITFTTTGVLSYGVFPVTVGANGVIFATATSQLNCLPGGDATIKIIAGTGTNPATGATIQATIVSNSMYTWAFAAGQGNGTRWLIKPGQPLVDGNSGSVVKSGVSINAETFIGGYTNIFLNPNGTDPNPTLGDVINLVFNNPGLPGNPVTVSYTVVSGDTGGNGYNNLTTHLTSAINANSTLAAAKIGAWSSSPPANIQIAQLSGTPVSTTIAYTKGTNTESINFGLFSPGSPSPGSLDTSANGAGVYSLTGAAQPDVNPAYPYTEMFTVANVPSSGIISLSPELTMTNCQPFNITTLSGLLTGLLPGTTYWLNVSIRSIAGVTVNYTNNYFNYMTY